MYQPCGSHCRVTGTRKPASPVISTRKMPFRLHKRFTAESRRKTECHAYIDVPASKRPVLPQVFSNQDLLRPKPTVDGVSLKPLHENFAVMVEGLDLNKPLSRKQQALVLHVMNEHKMLLFRGAPIDGKAQQRLLQCFPYYKTLRQQKEQYFNHALSSSIPKDPLLASQAQAHNAKLTKHGDLSAGELKIADQSDYQNCHKRHWHMDSADSKFVPEVSARYMIQPVGNGLDDTMFASTEQMYAALDSHIEEKILCLRVINQKLTKVSKAGPQITKQGSHRLELNSKPQYPPGQSIPSETQPFVIQDPPSSSPSILVSEQQINRFKGMSRSDSLTLLQKVLAAGTDDNKVYRHEWQADDFLVWANRKLIRTISVDEPWMAAEGKTSKYDLVCLSTKQPVNAAIEVWRRASMPAEPCDYEW